MDAADLADLFEPCGKVAVRRLFGGHGVYAGPVMVALESRGVVYLRVDALSRAAFAAEQSEPFVYERSGRKPMSLPYWRLPEAAFEDPDEMRRWFAMARDAAMRAASARRPSSRRRGDIDE
ncbi:TfoX/Sxy family protein [Alsobacter sp. SYSU M60028]|uniref:TfoX/Sxy family protein n=1 Tax=Alsobacter ponti TaxID=2962936 RepID=A0ABT1LFL0_9HYPH|nr:TfoX/Sxy family protein [Alsobacter ponti]MCP8940292.1 TfoX/Sxy family protein [Alsobacter ponti]